MSGGEVVVVYGPEHNGGRSVSFDLCGLRVLIRPGGAEKNEEARALADRLIHAEQMTATAMREAESMREVAGRANTNAQKAEARLADAIEGKRRLLGPALLVPVHDGDWSGPVWLLDPAKQDRGYGLRFDSLAMLRLAHPELWPVGTTDKGILLDSVAMGAGAFARKP